MANIDQANSQPVPRLALTVNALGLAGMMVTGAITYGRQTSQLEALQAALIELKTDAKSTNSILQTMQQENARDKSRVEILQNEIVRLQTALAQLQQNLTNNRSVK